MFLVLFILVTLLVYFCINYLTGKPHPKFPPGPYRWPIWGAYLQLLVENYKFPYKAMHWMARRYKTEVLGMYLGPFPTVVACSQASVRDLLNHPAMQGRVEAFVPIARASDGIVRGQVFIDGDRWQDQRRFMLRTLRDFGFGKRSKSFELIMEEEVRDFVDLLKSNYEEGVCNNGQVTAPVIFYAYFMNLAMQMFLGTRMPPAQYNKLREFVYNTFRFVQCLDPTTGAINITPWVRHFAPEFFGYNDFLISSTYITKFINDMVEEHKDTFLSNALRDYCDTYIKELKDRENTDGHHWFSEEEMKMSIWDTLFAATSTQSSTMGFVTNYLLKYPEWQAKARKEIDDVIGHSRLPTLEDRKNCPYTEAFLREVMRKETIAGLAVPHRATEDVYFYGYFIPKNTMVLANLYSNNMDEKIWGDPFEFKPERFLEEDGTLKRKDLSLPFSLGKHVCSGETFARNNLFLVLAAMLQNFVLELPEGHEVQSEKDYVTGILMCPKNFQVNMVAR